MLKASNNAKLYSLLILVIAALLYDVADSEYPFREPDFRDSAMYLPNY